MHLFVAFLNVLAALPAAHCIALSAPSATDLSPTRALNQWAPKTTKAPSIDELRKRQRNLNPETCGWVDKDFDSGVTCSAGRTCMLYTAARSIGMAGCCQAGDTQNCGWSNRCIDYKAYYSSSACDANCASNTFIRKCTNSAAPYCMTWTYPSNSVADYGCTSDPLSLIETVYQFATDSFGQTTTISLPTISGNAVVGFAGATTGGSATATGTSSTSSNEEGTKRKVSMSVIIGAVVGGLFFLGIIAALVIFLCVKQKRNRQLAANQQAISAAQANRPQSQYNPPMQQQEVVAAPPPVPAMPQITQPQQEGYFDTSKLNSQTHVQEYPAQTPISNPSTPAPPYAQPHYAPQGVVSPPMPSVSPVPLQASRPPPEAHEVDAISVPQTQQAQNGNVYEMGSGK